MRKLIFIIVIILIIFIIIPSETKSNEMRIRVIANSNSEVDQNFKLIVVSDMKEFLKNNPEPDIIKKRVEYLISKYDVSYGVKVAYRAEKFEAKEVNGNLIPGGNYKTLVISLGEAKGKNYWSLLYPEYFNVSFEDINSHDVEYRSWFFDLIRGDLK